VLRALIENGHVVNLILALVAVEVLVVAWLARGRRGGFGPIDALCNALAGVGLLLALRAALAGASWREIAAWLGFALLAHGADVARRWRRG